MLLKRLHIQGTACRGPTFTRRYSSAATQQTTLSVADGEFEGVTASFNREGKPIPLPDRFVPDAFRDWGVTLTDWQSQSSCQMSVGNDQYLIRLRKMMPTVGCEADAVVYTEDLLPIKISSFDVATGSFVGVSGSLSLPSSPSFDLHFCFGNATSKSRVRLIATFFPSDACSPPHLQNLSVVSETWVGPKGCNEELLGCGGGSPPFSQEPPSPFTPFDTTKLLSGPLSGTLSICLPLSLTVQIASKSSTEGRLQSLAVQVKKGNHGKGIIATATLCESGLTTELLEV